MDSSVKVVLPYVKSYPKADVIWAEDTVFELFDNHLEITLNSIEEIPKEDEALGREEKIRDGIVCLMRAQISGIETSYDSVADKHDFTIFTTSNDSWGYNCASKAEARKYYNILKDWLVK